MRELVQVDPGKPLDLAARQAGERFGWEREQAERLRERAEDPRKRWKLDAADLAKRALYDDYVAAYEDLLQRTSSPWAPWHVVPADRKWVRNLIVTEMMVETLEALDLRWPDLSPEILDAARNQASREPAAATAAGGPSRRASGWRSRWTLARPAHSP